MLVSNLQQFLRLLVPPLTAVGVNATAGKSVTSSLESLAAALEPFASGPFAKMTTDDLAELLRCAEGYRQTGVIPESFLSMKAATPKTKAPKATTPKPPKITPSDAVAKLKDLQERCLSLEPSGIAREVQTLSSLTVPELKKVQLEFLGVAIGKSKDQAIAALQKKIDDSRASRERVQGILAY